jgi:triacylglycerol lipase
MRTLLIASCLVLASCSSPSGGENQSESLSQEWPNDPVIFYATKTPPIDFRTFQPKGNDKTALYFKYFNEKDQVALPPDLERLRGYKVIFIQGIMGNYVDFMGKLIYNHFDQYEYFYDQMDWLKSVGVEYELLKVDTEDSVEINKWIVEDAIVKSSKPVLLVPHSKGGIETIMALVEHPFLYQKVAGLLSLQAPYYGTTVADYLQDIKVWDFLANFVLMVLGGSNEALHDLTTYERVPWMKHHEIMTKYIQKQIPVLSFSTYKDDEPARRDSTFEFSRNKVKTDGGADNDGLIPWNSMILPDSNYVAFEGQDHASTVTDNPYIKFDRERFFKALLRVLFSKQ